MRRADRIAACLAAMCLALALVALGLALALAVMAAPAGARDLGIRGAYWHVAEPDLLEQIEAHLAGMERSGELARLQDEARARARELVEEPDPVPGIVPARERRTRRIDPSIVVARDIRGPDGALLAAAGTRIDPFDHAPLTRDLLFVDGRREAEVAWALAHPRPARIVLLAGRPLDLSRTHGRVFFFDLGGRFAERFAIRETPALLARDGAGLRLDAIPVGDCAAGTPAYSSTDNRRNEPC